MTRWIAARTTIPARRCRLSTYGASPRHYTNVSANCQRWLSSREAERRGICFSLSLEADRLYGVANAAHLLQLRSPRRAGARAPRARLQIRFCERERADPSLRSG